MIIRSGLMLVVTVLLTLAVLSGAGGEVPPDAAPKVAAVISLTHTSPVFVMNRLGLVSSAASAEEGVTPVWIRPVKAAGTDASNPQKRIVPDGIDLLAAYEPDKALIAYGSTEGIAELRQLISLFRLRAEVGDDGD